MDDQSSYLTACRRGASVGCLLACVLTTATACPDNPSQNNHGGTDVGADDQGFLDTGSGADMSPGADMAPEDMGPTDMGPDDAGVDMTTGDTGLADTGGGDAGTDMGAMSPRPRLEIDGVWDSNFGSTERIAPDRWDFGSFRQLVVDFDNDGNFAITQNPSDAMFDPDTFSKIVWTEPAAGTFHYCTVDFGLATAEEARETTKTADDSDPSTGGCGGNPWTELTVVPPEIEGTWSSNFGSTETIDAERWDFGSFEQYLVEWNNEQNVAYTRNLPDAMFDPGAYSKIVWTEPAAKTFYYCTVDFGLASITDARDSTKTADDSDPSTGGCGGNPWTELTEQ
jgi:hypothetical protein